ncbi:thiamine phosphate synthase [Pelagibacterales bacterium SAG-MED13]|nr:thiamine phosphate synthase [Pelagibacterales bacterium SAG-MED13]
MHIKKLKKYYFINKLEVSHLFNLDRDISFIWRNKDKQTNLKTLIELRNFCKVNNRKFYISNDIKLAIKIKANGVYIPSTNRDLGIKSFKFDKKFKILGSAHNLKEIKIKELQNIKEIFLSPLFKSNKNPELNIYKYLNLKKRTSLQDISLGGIDHINIKKLKFINPLGFAAISFFDKKKAP